MDRKPKSFTTAIWIMIATVILNIAADICGLIALDFGKNLSLLFIGSSSAFLILYIFLIHGTYKCIDGARIIITAILCIGIISDTISFIHGSMLSREIIFNSISVVLSIATLIFLFSKSSREWHNKNRVGSFLRHRSLQNTNS